MQKFKAVVSMLLILTFAVSLALPLTVNAQAVAPSQLNTYAVIDAVPNPVGVGEDVLLRFGILQATGDPTWGWTGLTVTIGKPDGTTQTLGPYTTDSTGSTFANFKPSVAGTYKLTTNFPQQTVPVTFYDLERNALIFAGTVMKASHSETIDLVVQQDPLPGYPGQPLPTGYWSRIVDPQLREWYKITGNWYQRPKNGLVIYNDDAPETAHVLWAKPYTTGGLTGGLWGEGQVPSSSETGDAYAGKFIDSVVMGGVLYYNRDDAKVGSNGICAVDLRTGEELWFRNNSVLSFGQNLYFNSFNYDGVYDYLWDASAGTTWKAYDPFTGEWIYTMINVPSGTRVFGPSGEILIYQIDYATRRLALWNSTAAGQTAPGFVEPTSYGSWGAYYGGQLVHGSTINASDPRSYSWNVTIPAGLTAGQSFFTPILEVYPDRVVSIDFNQTRVRVWGISIAAGTRGQPLFDKTWTPPTEWLEGFNTLHYVGASNDVEGGVIAVWSKELRRHYGFSLQTGSYLWETDSEHWLDAYGWGNAEHTWYFAYGKLFSVGVGGILYAYDLATGDTAWTYTMSDPYNEPVTGNNWWGWITHIADGKVYVGTVEHSAEMPIPRGGPYICIDAETGAEVWRVNGMYRQTRWGGCAVMGDSIIATMDTYDQQIYAVGKGATAASVTASPKASVYGSSVIIEGTVTDISPGTQDDEIKMRFPNGVPAVADESMSEWMLYVYKQFTQPMDAKGVEVTLSVLDSNNNYRDIGKVTTNSDGFFTLNWEPDIEGPYTVYASFTGSKAYWPSHAVTSFVVDPAPEVAPPPETPPDNTGTLIMYATIGIIAAIAIVGLVIILMLRKR